MKNQLTAAAYKVSPELSRVLIIGCVGFLVLMAFDFQYPSLFRAEKAITDFDAFYIAGKMFWDGTLNQAYNYKDFFEAQQKLYGTNTVMVWSYPPQFNFITAALAVLPAGLAYFTFIGLTFASYLLTIKSISSDYLGSVILAIFPAILINIRSGQNGFLTGTIVGLFCLAFMKRKAVAGLPLGLMIIKPHLAAGIAVLSLISKRWSTLGVALLTVALTLIVSTIIFGPGIWLAFAEGVKDASRLLALGAFPSFRMTSIYATLHEFGVPSTIALIIQLLIALAACSTIAISYIKLKNPRHIIGMTATASLYISPYSYDYDLTLLGIAVAALLPYIASRAKPIEMSVLFFLSWAACGWGLVQSTLTGNKYTNIEATHTDPIYALSSIALILLTMLTLHILLRGRLQEPSAHDY